MDIVVVGLEVSWRHDGTRSRLERAEETRGTRRRRGGSFVRDFADVKRRRRVETFDGVLQNGRRRRVETRAAGDFRVTVLRMTAPSSDVGASLSDFGVMVAALLSIFRVVVMIG